MTSSQEGWPAEPVSPYGLRAAQLTRAGTPVHEKERERKRERRGRGEGEGQEREREKRGKGRGREREMPGIISW